MQIISLFSSMPFESDQILSRLKNVRSLKIAGKAVYKGKLQGADVLLTHTGIGKVNAAHAATCLIESFPIGKVINFGVGGAYPGSGLSIGDIAIASREIYGDDGVVGPDGWSGMDEIGIPLVKTGEREYFNEFPLTHPLLPIFKGENSMMNGHFKIKTGNFVTVSSTSGTQKRARELERRFRAVCENMEGAAIAHVCAVYKIPMIEVRGISNMTGIRDKRKWNLKRASENCQRIVFGMISSLTG